MDVGNFTEARENKIVFKNMKYVCPMIDTGLMRVGMGVRILGCMEV